MTTNRDTAKRALQIIESLGPSIRDIIPKAELDSWDAKLKEEAEAIANEWERTYGVAYPATIDDWVRQYARASDAILIAVEKRYIPSEVLPAIEGYLLRLQDFKAANVPTQAEDKKQSDRLLTREQIAERVQRTDRWVRDHKAELGEPDLRGAGQRPHKWSENNEKVKQFISNHGPMKCPPSGEQDISPP